jgi:hypothetical protein
MSLEVLKGGLFKGEWTPKDNSQMILKILTCHFPGPIPIYVLPSDTVCVVIQLSIVCNFLPYLIAYLVCTMGG